MRTAPRSNTRATENILLLLLFFPPYLWSRGTIDEASYDSYNGCGHTEAPVQADTIAATVKTNIATKKGVSVPLIT